MKMIVLHHLNLLNISWETFIANDIFRGPQTPPPLSQELEGPSSSAQVNKDEKSKDNRVIEVPETYKTYQRGTRKLFVSNRKVLAPIAMEGTLPSSSTE